MPKRSSHLPGAMILSPPGRPGFRHRKLLLLLTLTGYNLRIFARRREGEHRRRSFEMSSGVRCPGSGASASHLPIDCRHAPHTKSGREAGREKTAS